MLEYDAAFFIPDLKSYHRVGLLPVDLYRAEVHFEVRPTDPIGVDLVGEAGAGLGEVAAGLIESAAGDVEEGIAHAVFMVARQQGNFGQVSITAEEDHTVGLGFADQCQQPLPLVRKIAPFLGSVLVGDNPDRVQQLLDYNVEEGPGRYGIRLWMLITFELWRRIVIEGEPV